MQEHSILEEGKISPHAHHLLIREPDSLSCGRDPWVLPIEANARRAATAAKQALSDGAGGCSDHLALVRAFNAWTAERARGREFAYAAATFVSNGTMSMIDGMRMQLLGELTVCALLLSALHSMASR